MRKSILLAAMLAAAGMANGGPADAHTRIATENADGGLTSITPARTPGATPLRYEYAELKKGVPARAKPPARPARSTKHPKPPHPSRA